VAVLAPPSAENSADYAVRQLTGPISKEVGFAMMASRLSALLTRRVIGIQVPGGGVEKSWRGSVSPFEETNRENCRGSQVRDRP
jgi:hypothetical protein